MRVGQCFVVNTIKLKKDTHRPLILSDIKTGVSAGKLQITLDGKGSYIVRRVRRGQLPLYLKLKSQVYIEPVEEIINKAVAVNKRPLRQK